MKEILAENLQPFFDNSNLKGKCTYQGEQYEVWEVSDKTFEIMCDMDEDKFARLCPDGMWRSAEGSNMGAPNTIIHVGENKILGWYSPWDEDSEEELEIYASNLTKYFCYYLGVSQPRNVCALAVDLAKYNHMTLGELFNKYEG